jgi:aryl-alcohol dehydrogenase-like predicted oxidoreductase
MEYRQLGKSGLRISTISLGTMGFGGTGWASVVGQIDVDDARRQIGLARDAGVNLIDTADVYSAGMAEEIVGEALGSSRADFLLATKVRMPMGNGPNDAGLSRHHIVRGLEASLRRLRTDYIDLYQVHEWDGQTALEETLTTLDSLVQAGKIRYIGASNYAAWQLMKALGISRQAGLCPFSSQQTTRSRLEMPRTSSSRFRLTKAWVFSCGALLQVVSCPANIVGGKRHLTVAGIWAIGMNRQSTTRTSSTKPLRC